jgi:microsomal dipeptidase-like Zn-dependent dipeptidase
MFKAHYPRQGYALNAPGQGHVNRLGLTPTGEVFLREAMRQGFILDVEHMSERCTDAVLSLAEQARYPVLASHCAFREQGLETHETSIKAKRASEHMKTREQARRILALGGLLAPITNQQELKDFPGGTVPNDCARSSKTWAQSYQYALSLLNEVGAGGVAMGTDFNGLNEQPGPRYGDKAAYGLKDDSGARSGAPSRRCSRTTSRACPTRAPCTARRCPSCRRVPAPACSTSTRTGWPISACCRTSSATCSTWG